MKDNSFQKDAYCRYFLRRTDSGNIGEGWLNTYFFSKGDTFGDDVLAALTDMRPDYTDFVILEMCEPASAEIYGKEGRLTYIQSVMREDCIQTEMHFEMEDGTQLQFVRFRSEIEDTFGLYRYVMSGGVPDTDEFDDITEFIFGRQE